jgi:G3E family GTPase
MRAGWGKPIVVDVLTGFLGSGKTTLLNRLLKSPDLKDTAVLVNEFGEIGLDHLLIENVEGDVVLLKSGCVCCTIRGDLKDALIRMHDRRQKGEVPPFKRLVIETTGLADPAPIVATVLTDPMLRHHFRMGSIVTVVDAIGGARNLERRPEALRQVAAADRIVISKTDLASPASAAVLREKLARINPSANTYESNDGTGAYPTLLTAEATGKTPSPAPFASERGTLRRERGGSTLSSHGTIRSFMLTAEAPVDWLRFGLWLSMLLNRHGQKVLRLKGLVAVESETTPVIIQGVQHLIHKPAHLKAWPDNDRRTRLVVIAEDLDPSLVQRSFAAFTRRQPSTVAGSGGHRARAKAKRARRSLAWG